MPVTLLLSISALGVGCFAPDASSTTDEPVASTGDEPADDIEDDSVGDDSDDGESGGGESGGGESGGGESGGGGSEDTVGADAGADTSDTGLEGAETGDTGASGDTDDGETGAVCDEELGTHAHCLDCDDACGDSETCTASGCAAPNDVGLSDAFAGVGGYPGRLYGYALQVEDDAVLSSLNFHAVGNGGDVQLALYSDDSGTPSELLALSDVYGDYGAGPHALAVEPIELSAGTYWIMARNDFPSQIGLNFDPDILPPFALTSVFIEFDEAMPETLVDLETFNSYEINLWVTVLEPS